MALKTMTKTLQMAFIDAGGKSFTVSLKNPKPDVDKATVDAAATVIVTKNVFAKKEKDLVAFNEARLVSRTVETIDA